MKLKAKKPLGAVLAAMAMMVAVARGEYQQFSMQDFETPGGQWPAKLIHGHNSSPLTTQIVEFKADGFPPGFYEGGAPATLRSRGVRFQPIADDPHLSIINSSALAREKLGAEGGAIFQADYFFGKEDPATPTIAILAFAADSSAKGVRGYKFYRFGIDRNRVYFSFANEKAEPEIYLRQNLSEFDLKRNSWHRFQMIFKGQDQIQCAIDGQLTSFSPITESTLVKLQPGLMVTRSKEGDGTIYADNLSILWSANGNDAPPPSPWAAAVPGATVVALSGNRWNTSHITWLTSPSQAWKEAVDQKRVIFALFHDETPATNAKLQSLIASPEAEGVITRCVPLRVNMSDTAGAQIAKNYEVTASPTLVVIGADGKAKSKVLVDASGDLAWAPIYAKLRESQ